MIQITTIDDKRFRVTEDGWDFPINELGYLLEEHDGETFILYGWRLYEAEEV